MLRMRVPSLLFRTPIPRTHLHNMSSSKPTEQQKPEANAPQLNGLEEDDEFEEFAAQGKCRKQESHQLCPPCGETRPAISCQRLEIDYIPPTTQCEDRIHSSLLPLRRSFCCHFLLTLTLYYSVTCIIDWNEAEEEKDAHQWDDNWDDDDVEDDFSQQLRY